jgi:predicted RNA-binding protein with TRAM domain
MKRLPVRQGDVLLVPIEEVPQGCKPVARVGGRVILAEGEVTGHDVALVIGEMERRFLEVGDGGATLVHDEHAGIAVAPGHYEVLIHQLAAES